MEQFVAGDVHGSTTTFSVRSASGKVVQRTTVDTTGGDIVAFLRSLRGTVHLTFEEGPMAQWMFDVCRDHVQDVLVCDPRKNRLLAVGNKSDDIDADKLSELLFLGSLKRVYHPEGGSRLKELAHGYQVLVKRGVQDKNCLKALFRSRAIEVAGDGIYDKSNRDEWLAKLQGVRRERATWVYGLLDNTERLKEEALKAMTKEARRHPEWKILQTVPGLGHIRAALVSGFVGTPYRFRTKRQFWSYVGFGVVTRSSADYKRTKNGPRKQKPHTRGLNRNRHAVLKSVFKGAALQSIQETGEFRQRYEQMLQAGTEPEMALLTIARKIAAVTLHIWKSGEEYDPKKAIPQTATPP
jgi:transposase